MHRVQDAGQSLGSPNPPTNPGALAASGVVSHERTNASQSYSAFRAPTLAVHAQAALSQNLAQRLEGSAVTVNIFHPVNVRSDLFRTMPVAARFAMNLAQTFLAKDSKSAVRSALCPDLSVLSEPLVLAKGTLPPPFEQHYCQPPWEAAKTY